MAFEKRPGLAWLMAHVSHQSDDCLLWPFCFGSGGYGTFDAYKVFNYAHRYMCELCHGHAPSDNHQATHECGNTKCVNPRHLSWKTPAGNQLDRRKHGTATVTKFKLTSDQVIEIRSIGRSLKPARIAARFNVTEANIRQIQSRKTWRNLPAMSPSSAERAP